MADLFLHLPFARRLRLAEGLHPLVGEALTRRPALVCMGAALAQLPQNERKNMSFLRRLFSRGGEAAKWQKLLGPAPAGRVDLIASVLQKGDVQGGSMMRLATALGLLAADVLEDALAPLTASLPPNEKAGIERAQARLWLQAVAPNTKDLEREWRVVQELGEADLQKNAVAHLDRAIQRVHGASPGEAVLLRWLKGLANDAAPLLDTAKSGGLPPSVGVIDANARAPHFEQNGFLEKAQGAVSRFVFLANRLAEQLTVGTTPGTVTSSEVEKDAVVAALVADGKLLEPPSSLSDVQQAGDAAKVKWKEWLSTARTAALVRGRNPKPAFGEGDEAPPARAHNIPGNPSATGVMRLADIPPVPGSSDEGAPLPEASATGAPPVPEQSGANVPPAGFNAPALTQEVSIAQIEAETASARAGLPADPQGFETPAHTQEVSVAMIEELRPQAGPPASAVAAPESAPTSDHTASAPSEEHKNGKTGDAPVADAAPAHPEPAKPSDGASATDPPRE
jgi:hypothetical protein